MRVVSAQLQLSTRTGPQSHATPRDSSRLSLPDLSDLSDLPTIVPPLLPLAGADSTLSKEFLMRQNTAVCSGYRSINFSCAHVSRQYVFFSRFSKTACCLEFCLESLLLVQ